MGVYSGNRTLLGESVSSNNIGHVLDMVIECERNDLHLFEAVINCDMIEAFTEAGLTTLVREDADNAKQESKKGIVRKIKELFIKAFEAIKRFIATFIAKLSNFFSNDAKLYKQYIDNFEKNAVGYKIDGWTPINYSKSQDFVNGQVRYGDFVKYEGGKKISFPEVRSLIEKAQDNDAIDKAVEEYKKQSKESNIAKSVDELIWGPKAEKKDDYEITSADKDFIKKMVKDGKNAINSARNMGNFAIKQLKEDQRQLKNEKYEKDDKDSLGLARVNAEYKLSTIQIKDTQKLLNVSVNALHRVLAQCRRAFIAAGKNATEQKATKESALYDYILGEASDIYVESALSMS